MTTAATVLDDVAVGLKAVIDDAGISSLGEDLTVYDTEPRTVLPPAVAISGPTRFLRRPLDQRESQLGARDWLLTYRLTLFINLAGDVDRDQREMRSVLGRIIDAIDGAPQLSGGLGLLEAKLTTGTQSFTPPTDAEGNTQRQMVVYPCDLEAWVLLP